MNNLTHHTLIILHKAAEFPNKRFRESNLRVVSGFSEPEVYRDDNREENRPAAHVIGKLFIHSEVKHGLF